MSGFGEPVPTASASALCSWLTEVEPVVVLCCCSPSASRLDVLSIPRCLSALHNCTVCGSAYLSYGSFSVSLAILCWPLSNQQGISVCRIGTHWVFRCFSHHSEYTLETVVPGDQQLQIYSNKPVCHQQSCHGWNHREDIFPHSDGWFTLTEAPDPYLHAFMHGSATRLAD